MGADRVLTGHDVVLAITVDEDRYTTVPEGEWLLKNAWFIPAAATAADATDYVTVSVRQGATVLGTFNTDVAGGSLVAGIPVPFSLSGGAALEFKGGTDSILSRVLNVASGVAVNGRFQYELVKLSRDV